MCIYLTAVSEATSHAQYFRSRINWNWLPIFKKPEFEWPQAQAPRATKPCSIKAWRPVTNTHQFPLSLLCSSPAAHGPGEAVFLFFLLPSLSHWPPASTEASAELLAGSSWQILRDCPPDSEADETLPGWVALLLLWFYFQGTPGWVWAIYANKSKD